MSCKKGRATGLMDLDGAFRATRHLHSQDARDRVYGALECVDWKGSTPIQPDYSKTTYQLVITVLQKQTHHRRNSAVFMRATAHSRFKRLPGICHVDLAAELARSLQISRLDTEASAGLRLRKITQERIQEGSHLPLARCHDDHWHGYRISDDGCSLDLISHGQHELCVLREGRVGQNARHHDKTAWERIPEGARPLKSANECIIGMLPAEARERMTGFCNTWETATRTEYSVWILDSSFERLMMLK